MGNKFTAKASIDIHAPVNKVWQALTDPELIKEYLFGTHTTTDWQKGSSITYSGIWEGKPYEDRGIIVDIIPGKLLHTTYFSYLSGKPDIPENYANVIYEVQPQGDGSRVTISQDNIDDESLVKHSEDNWGMVLQSMKKLLEK